MCVSVLRRHYISIHVPREGHDHIILAKIINISQFQSTCPARGTTANDYYFETQFEISIHVPREGHDGIVR